MQRRFCALTKIIRVLNRLHFLEDEIPRAMDISESLNLKSLLLWFTFFTFIVHGPLPLPQGCCLGNVSLRSTPSRATHAARSLVHFSLSLLFFLAQPTHPFPLSPPLLLHLSFWPLLRGSAPERRCRDYCTGSAASVNKSAGPPKVAPI